MYVCGLQAVVCPCRVCVDDDRFIPKGEIYYFFLISS